MKGKKDTKEWAPEKIYKIMADLSIDVLIIILKVNSLITKIWILLQKIKIITQLYAIKRNSVKIPWHSSVKRKMIEKDKWHKQ